MSKIKIDVYNDLCETCQHLEITRQGTKGKFYSICHFPSGCMQKKEVLKTLKEYIKILEKEIEENKKEETQWPVNQ